METSARALAHRAGRRGPSSKAGFTLMELMVVIGVIVALAALLMPVLSLVKRKSAMTSAANEVKQLALCLETYRTDDAAKRFPPPQSDTAIASVAPTPGSTALLTLLEQQGTGALRIRPLDGQGRLTDPWGRPYQYSLVRPVVSDPASLHDWNWDTALARERAWGRRWDATAKAVAEGTLPFPYVCSLGEDGRSDVGAGWIHVEDLK
jgi:prepilin-type N-terminal cleavage/methylation domain-containing protein